MQQNVFLRTYGTRLLWLFFVFYQPVVPNGTIHKLNTIFSTDLLCLTAHSCNHIFLLIYCFEKLKISIMIFSQHYVIYCAVRYNRLVEKIRLKIPKRAVGTQQNVFLRTYGTRLLWSFFVFTNLLYLTVQYIN